MSYFSIIGIIYVLHLLYRFISFVTLYFFGHYPLDDYLTGGSLPYAIVTGASDGIGKGIAKELYQRGFNLILHGRNAEKVKKVVDEIRPLRNGPDRDIRTFLADATKGDHDFQGILAPFMDLNISILINNVGGSNEISKLDEWPVNEVVNTLNWNLLFPLGLVHALLPKFRNRGGKCLIVHVGSAAGEVNPPRLAVYAACKRFLKTLSRALCVDEKYYTPTNVRSLYLNVGEVSTNSLRKPVAPMRPDADTFGKAVVDRLACGRWEVTPYVYHQLHVWFILALGESVAERLMAWWVKKLFELKDQGKDGKKKD